MWRNPRLRRLFGAQVLSLSGSGAYVVALAAVVIDRHRSVEWIGLLAAARYIPAALAMPAAGHLVDRVPKARALVGSDLAATAVQIALIALLASGGPLTALVALAAVGGVVQSVYQPGVGALLPELSGPDDLVAANSIGQLVYASGVVAGPAIGGLLLVVASPSWALGYNAATFAISALLVAGLDRAATPAGLEGPAPVGAPPASGQPAAPSAHSPAPDPGSSTGAGAGLLSRFGTAVALGLRALWSARPALYLAAVPMVGTLVFGADQVLLPAVSRGPLHAGATAYPWLLAALGLGGALCAPFVESLTSGRSSAVMVVAGFAVFTAPTALLVVSHSVPLDVAVEAVQGTGTIIADVVGLTALQLALPAGQRGRALGVFFALVAAAPGLGSLLAGSLVGFLGLDWALLVLGPALALGAVASLPSLARRTRVAGAAEAEAEPVTAAG